MKLFKTTDIAKIDQYTIENEPISDIDLMERASSTVANYLTKETDVSGKIFIFCGPGNNGGDGLAIAHLLANEVGRFKVSVYLFHSNRERIGSPAIILERLKALQKVEIYELTSELELPEIHPDDVIIDALFGSGLNRALDGFAAIIVKHMNHSGAEILSIDIPSGLMGEDNSTNIPENIIKATKTITFQFPKISFLFPENECYVGDWTVSDIGLHADIICSTVSHFYLLDDEETKALVKTRSKFSHKGTFGHALLIAGSYGKMGAAILSSKACLRSGVGLLTTHIPHTGYQIIQTAVPEAMICIDESDLMFTSAPHLGSYNAIGIGPAIGQKVNTQRGLKVLLENIRSPIVIDADALNILGEHKDWLTLLPENAILTPHPREFERLAGKTENGFQRMQLAIEFAVKYKIVLIVKGAHSMIVSPNGEVWFNTTGNPGMATAGSGDALTGIILALLAQGYVPFDAARVGTYVHGLAGDIGAANRGYEALIASDLIESLGEAFKLLHKF